MKTFATPIHIRRVFIFMSLTFATGYTYRPEGKTDPFAPLSLMRPTLSGTTRLQQHDINEFELVGTLYGKEPTALLMTPSPKEGVIARVGDRIGRHGGRVLSITRQQIIAREPLAKAGGNKRFQFSDVIIPLSKVKLSETVVQTPALRAPDISREIKK
ncbi:MAG: Pilus assembly protein PilP [Pseudomonadota bacterium]|jgi:Tfp pilus assembly protein PilP